MKLFINGDLLKNATVIRVSAFVLISFAFFYLGKHWSDNGFQQLIFFSATTSRPPTVSVSPNFNKTYNVYDLISRSQASTAVPITVLPPRSPPPSVEVKRFGIVDMNGTMSDEFQIGEFDAESAESSGNQTEIVEGGGDGGGNEMLNLTTRLCWKLVKKAGYIAIWQKPFNNSCYLSRDAGTKPPLCDLDDDPDNVWYADLKACITRIPDNGYGSNIAPWPARLLTPPDRLQTLQIDSYIARKELFKAESKYWSEIIGNYVRALHWKEMGLRNVLDMRAGFGGFAAALIEQEMDCWVLNVVPVSGSNTLPVIYDRGLLGVVHDWCEPFDTYPRTYDLLHAAGLFSVERQRCNMSTIMLEMDRILRPGGRVYIRDSIDVVNELQDIGNALGWHTSLRDTHEGPHSSYRILTCDKRLK